jgi:hypothetical protein
MIGLSLRSLAATEELVEQKPRQPWRPSIAACGGHSMFIQGASNIDWLPNAVPGIFPNDGRHLNQKICVTCAKFEVRPLCFGQVYFCTSA